MKGIIRHITNHVRARRIGRAQDDLLKAKISVALWKRVCAKYHTEGDLECLAKACAAQRRCEARLEALLTDAKEKGGAGCSGY